MNFKRKIFIFSSLSILFMLIYTRSASAATYTVAQDGSGDFTTIQAGVDTAYAGDSLYIRKGSYTEEVSISNSGTSSNPIIIKAYPGEEVNIRGDLPDPDFDNPHQPTRGSIPSSEWSSLVTISGNWIVFDGFIVSNSSGDGIATTGDHITLRDNKSQYNWRSGIRMISGSGVIIQNNEVYYSSRVSERLVGTCCWSSAISISRGGVKDVIVRRNVVHEHWGIGINAYEANQDGEGEILFEDNIVWNVSHSHYYMGNCYNATYQRNISYNTPDSIFYYQKEVGGSRRFGDSFNYTDEVVDSTNLKAKNAKVINNLFWRGNTGFYFYNQTSEAESGLNDLTFANNTIIDPLSYAFIIYAGAHSDSLIANNIIVSNHPITGSGVGDPGITFSHNLWTVAPPSDVRSENPNDDIIGDPHISRTGSITGGELAAEWFKLTSSSPAIDRGIPLPEVFDDYFRSIRDTNPDIGAHEYSGTQPSTTPLPTNTPKPTVTNTPTTTPPQCTRSNGDANGDGRAALYDYAVWANYFAPFVRNYGGPTVGDFNCDNYVDLTDYASWAYYFTPI
ncbi:right-handed parallel beta-helix repeat-containing protein [Candidatus Woesebacteria bacterium]|nr:right-handed parallel beta-helix repeat-containing protein [Candidatus Woesebacteria bacterium]